MEEIAHRLRQGAGADDAHADRREADGDKPRLTDAESRIAYDFAQEYGIWFDSPFTLGQPGPSGDENDTVIGSHFIYKVNNLMHCGGSLSRLLEKVRLHNMLFPLTRYELVGFTNYGFAATVFPIFSQTYIHDAVNATEAEIADFMRALDFLPCEDKKGGWQKNGLIVWDLLPKNVLKGPSGVLYVVDAELMV